MQKRVSHPEMTNTVRGSNPSTNSRQILRRQLLITRIVLRKNVRSSNKTWNSWRNPWI